MFIQNQSYDKIAVNSKRCEWNDISVTFFVMPGKNDVVFGIILLD